ncbi:hypothetical protein G7Y79_00023g053940 [Physcia stellaris]|nr:hypothetical protein G7Y79_00023g053940 [Physcia stellaris]
MQQPYIPEFADHMSTGSYATTFDLLAQLSTLNIGTTTHINTLQSDGDPFYHRNHPDYFPLAAILFKANAESYHLAGKISAELARYEANMRLLLQEFAVKYLALVYKHGSYEEAQERLGTDLMESALALGALVHDVEAQEPRKGYLTEIFRFWRRYASTKEWTPYEEVWTFVAGRKLPTKNAPSPPPPILPSLVHQRHLRPRGHSPPLPPPPTESTSTARSTNATCGSRTSSRTISPTAAPFDIFETAPVPLRRQPKILRGWGREGEFLRGGDGGEVQGEGKEKQEKEGEGEKLDGDKRAPVGAGGGRHVTWKSDLPTAVRQRSKSADSGVGEGGLDGEPASGIAVGGMSVAGYEAGVRKPKRIAAVDANRMCRSPLRVGSGPERI